MKVTMEDIAKLSGVSKATVSYVLNQKRSSLGLSSRTVMKVLETSHKLNYRPDSVAVALSQQKGLPLSLLILSPWLYTQFSDFMAQVNKTLSSESERQPLKVSYELFHPGLLQKNLTVSKTSKFNVVLVLGTASEDNLFLQRHQKKFSNIVLLNREVSGYPCSYGNDREACQAMSERIAGCGYYHRYVLGCSKNPSHCEEKRIQGFAEGLKKHNVNYDFFDLDDVLTPEQQVLEMYSHYRIEHPALFFLPQYHPAALLLRLFQKIGVAVPEEAGIACYDRHSLLSDFLRPELTTIDPNIGEMTRNALEIAQAIKEGSKAENRISYGVFVPGGTSILHDSRKKRSKT